MRDYDPFDWHWQIGDDESRYWSSAAGGYVEALPEDAGLSRIDTAENLSGALAAYGLRGPAMLPVHWPLKRWEFKLVVQRLGIADAIEAAIASLPAEADRVMLRYLDSDTYRRDDPLFDQLAPLVGVTGQQIDTEWMKIARPAGGGA